MKPSKALTKALIFIGTFLLFLSSCEKDDANYTDPILLTTEVSEIRQTTAVAGGNVINDGGLPVTARGVVWSTSQNPTVSDSKTEDGNGRGEYESYLTDLQPNTTYYLRAYVTNSKQTFYAKEITFTTIEEVFLPTLSTVEVAELTINSAVINSNITDDGGAAITARGVVWSTDEMPTIEGNKTNDGTGSGEFTSSITDLEMNTLYYVRAYATNSEGTQYGNQISFTTPVPDGAGEKLTDIEGNEYKTLWINGKQWMAENLRVIKYNDGSEIPLVTSNDEWMVLTTPAYSWYNNDEETYGATYGVLYNWFVVNTGKLCPEGWHVPSDDEWTGLIDFLGGEEVAGGKLKSTSNWLEPNTGATDAIGMNMQPSGARRDNNGTFFRIEQYAFFWSSTENNEARAWQRHLYNGNEIAKRGYSDKKYGFAVRCVKDN